MLQAFCIKLESSRFIVGSAVVNGEDLKIRFHLFSYQHVDILAESRQVFK
jgi:hypothetical protein